MTAILVVTLLAAGPPAPPSRTPPSATVSASARSGSEPSPGRVHDLQRTIALRKARRKRSSRLVFSADASTQSPPSADPSSASFTPPPAGGSSLPVLPVGAGPGLFGGLPHVHATVPTVCT